MTTCDVNDFVFARGTWCLLKTMNGKQRNIYTSCNLHVLLHGEYSRFYRWTFPIFGNCYCTFWLIIFASFHHREKHCYVLYIVALVLKNMCKLHACNVSVSTQPVETLVGCVETQTLHEVYTCI